MNGISLSQSSIKKIPYFTFLRCIAMAAVVGIHVISPTIHSYSKGLSNVQFFIATFIYSFLSLWAVPCFVMISGALFLNAEKDIPIKRYYTKYILRLVLVLLSFGILFAIMELFFTEHRITYKTFFVALKNIYTGNLWDHMWFIYMLIGLYIITPVLKIITQFGRVNLLRYFLLVLFVFTSIIPLLDSITGTKCGIGIPTASVWLFYYLLGYSLHYEIIKIDTNIILLGLFVSLVWCSVGQFIPGNVESSNFGYKLRYSSPTDIIGIISSTSIFLLAKKYSPDIDWFASKIAPLSFGVYIIHQVFLNFIYKVLHFTPIYYNAYFVWCVSFLITLAMSMTVVWLLRKITFVRKLIL